MPWKANTPMTEREAFIETAQREGANISALCRSFGISRKTGYKWLGRYRRAGAGGLVEQSRRPQASPRQSDPALEAQIIAARQQHPAWGARKLKRWLENQGLRLPAVSTVHTILQRHGLIHPAVAAQHRPYQRFEMSQPNALWQMDFKGDFALKGGGRCYPLTVLDDHSRFLLGLVACADQRTDTVQAALTRLFQTYGLPERMLMDNGAPWGDSGDNPWTVFTAWLLRLGIRVSHGRPRHPQTQGKDERLHRTLQAELLSRFSADQLADYQPVFDDWRAVYNQQRPHQALDLAVPASRYVPSPRPFPLGLPPLVYPPPLIVRQVDSAGKISFRNRVLRPGRAFAGQPVGVLPLADPPGRVALFFAHTRIRTFDLAPDRL